MIQNGNIEAKLVPEVAKLLPSLSLSQPVNLSAEAPAITRVTYTSISPIPSDYAAFLLLVHILHLFS
jgi:hypothetical protein